MIVAIVTAGIVAHTKENWQLKLHHYENCFVYMKQEKSSYSQVLYSEYS